MATVTQQKDLVVALKKEIGLNVGILSKLQAMPSELSLQVFKENALEKPTQALFNHLSYYLICIIDHMASASLPWPLYDTKGERAYRNEVSSFISDYSNKGLLSPVMSSYLVNPACYKVTMLLFQMSQLAIQKLLLTKMNDSQKKLYKDVTEMYKSQEREAFFERIEKETDTLHSKVSNYLRKRKVTEKAAELMRNKITQMELKLQSLNAQKYIDDLVDGFVSKENREKSTFDEIIKIKDVSKPAPFFDRWLSETDRQIDELESKWSEKVSPLLSLTKNTQEQTESLIARCTGEADKNTYMIEYNHKTDFIDTKELQSQVNSQQKYILKNIVKDEKLSFPNLIRGFLIAICFVLKNEEVGDEIYKFNEYLEGSRRNYHEIVLAMRSVMERVRNAEAKLEPTPVKYHQSISVKDLPEIPPLPDLSDLRCTRGLQCPALFDSFTPLSLPKHQFNLRRRTSYSFTQPQPKSLINTYSQPKDDFLKSIISCKVSSYDRNNPNISHNFHNMSVLSKDNFNISVIPRVNETIAECTSGFTKQQILRLLSTKKSSSSKKFKYKTERPNIQIKKGGLFNESTNSSSESNGLFRSYSSPNLYENKRPTKAERRKLSIMKEANNSLLEVSGITALDRDSNHSTPTTNTDRLESTESVPVIIVNSPDKKFNQMLIDFNVDVKFNDTIKNEKTETPKNTERLITKTSSLEKIINRFKKVRANALPDKSDDIKSIAEEKENINIDMFTANRVLLPDLLSPSCSVIGMPEDQNLDEMFKDIDDRVARKPRESLGTALGVDQTFLDQFDLID